MIFKDCLSCYLLLLKSLKSPTWFMFMWFCNWSYWKKSQWEKGDEEAIFSKTLCALRSFFVNDALASVFLIIIHRLIFWWRMKASNSFHQLCWNRFIHQVQLINFFFQEDRINWQELNCEKCQLKIAKFIFFTSLTLWEISSARRLMVLGLLDDKFS